MLPKRGNFVTYDDLHDFLVEEFGVDPKEISPQTLLFSSGLIDSFALVALLTYIENKTDFFIPPTDVKLENFDSIERTLAYLQRVTAADSTPAGVSAAGG
jgi:acyl carrier protein